MNDLAGRSLTAVEQLFQEHCFLLLGTSAHKQRKNLEAAYVNFAIICQEQLWKVIFVGSFINQQKPHKVELTTLKDCILPDRKTAKVEVEIS